MQWTVDIGGRNRYCPISKTLGLANSNGAPISLTVAVIDRSHFNVVLQ